jgi:acetyl-CoA carboxylase biotin carboxyl carrier protein
VTRIPTDPEQIRQLAAVMAENDLIEVELVDKDTKVRVVRAAASGVTAVQTTSQPLTAISQAAPRHVVPPGSDDEMGHPGAVTSPMVGVAFLAPEPGAPAFVSIGQQVSAGETLLLIEAMKTFNQIKSAKAGVVTKIIVQNSTPVEYGQLLMIIE